MKLVDGALAGDPVLLHLLVLADGDDGRHVASGRMVEGQQSLGNQCGRAPDHVDDAVNVFEAVRVLRCRGDRHGELEMGVQVGRCHCGGGDVRGPQRLGMVDVSWSKYSIQSIS